MNTIQSQIDSIKLLLKLVLGYKNGSSEESIDLEKAGLSVDGQNYMTEVYDSIRDGIDADFSLTSNNLMNIRKKLTSSDGTSLSDGLDTLKENIDAQDKVIADLGTSVSVVKDLANKSWISSPLESNVFNVAGNVLTGFVKDVKVGDSKKTGYFILNDITGEGKEFLTVQFGRVEPAKDAKAPYEVKLPVPFKGNDYFVTTGIETKNISVTCGHYSVCVSGRDRDKFTLSLVTSNAKPATNHIGFYNYSWIAIGITEKQ